MNNNGAAVVSVFVRSIDVASKIVLPFLLGAAGWVTTQLWSHEGRLIYIESTQFTARDAQDTMIPLGNAIEELADSVSALQVSNAVTQQRLISIEQALSALKTEIVKNGD